MDVLSLKPSHKAVTNYYEELDAYARLGVKHEMAVRDAFQALLKECCKQAGLTFVGEWKIKRKGRNPLSVDGAMVGFDELDHDRLLAGLVLRIGSDHPAYDHPVQLHRG